MPEPYATLVTAIDTYTGDAQTLFNAGRANPFTPLPGEPPDATTKRAQGMVAAGLQKLEQAAEMQSKQDHRAGLAHVVALMNQVALTATDTCARIRTLVAGGIASTEVAELNALNATLTALAALSPAAVWATAPDDSSES